MKQEFKIDYQRSERIGLPEAIFCEGKADSVLHSILMELKDKKTPFLLTRLSRRQWDTFIDEWQNIVDYNELSQTGILYPDLVPQNQESFECAVVCAGSADLRVAYECQRTLNFLGINSKVFADLGAAGVWRFMECLPELAAYRVVVVVAGMEGALATVAGGLLRQPIIAVPTSVGYGVASGGHAALQAMLASCSSGIAVMNIDNGFGAACAVYRYLRSGNPSR